MSANDSTTGPGLSPEHAPVTFVRPVLRSLLITHTFLVLLVPLLLALFYYSTPHSRRQPIFLLNTLTLLLTFALGIILDSAGIYALLSQVLSPAVFVVTGAISAFQSMLIDLTLFTRLIVVYPLDHVGTRRFTLVTFLPVFLKFIRVINVIIFLKLSIDIMDSQTNGTNTFEAYYYALPNMKIEWVAQIVDNAYVSFMFLRSIHGLGVACECVCSLGHVSDTSLACRFRALFRIALSNFVIPTIFSLVLLVISFHDVTGDYVGDIVYVNSVVSAYGVIFASVWVGVEDRRKDQARQRSFVSDGSLVRRTIHNALSAGTQRSAIDLSSSLSSPWMGTLIDARGDESDVIKRGCPAVDLEASHEIALVPLGAAGELRMPH